MKVPSSPRRTMRRVASIRRAAARVTNQFFSFRVAFFVLTFIPAAVVHGNHRLLEAQCQRINVQCFAVR